MMPLPLYLILNWPVFTIYICGLLLRHTLKCIYLPILHVYIRISSLSYSVLGHTYHQVLKQWQKPETRYLPSWTTNSFMILLNIPLSPLIAKYFNQNNQIQQNNAKFIRYFCTMLTKLRHDWWQTYGNLRTPSKLSDQMMTLLSAEPDANRFPSLAYATQYTVPLWPLRDCSKFPSADP